MLISGNHDCWLGPRFQSRYRIQVQPGPMTVDLNGLRCFLAHGDELDHSFLNRTSRWLFRSPVARWGYSLLPQRIGYRLACSVARRTRANTNDPELASVFAQFAARKLQTGYQAVILGHLHQPVLQQLGAGWYLNTGDWVRHYSYGVLEQGRLRLEYWQD